MNNITFFYINRTADFTKQKKITCLYKHNKSNLTTIKFKIIKWHVQSAFGTKKGKLYIECCKAPKDKLNLTN